MKQCPKCHNEVFEVVNIQVDRRSLLLDNNKADDWICFICLCTLWDIEVVPICPVCCGKGVATTLCPEKEGVFHICTFEELWFCVFRGRQLLEDL